MSLTRPDSTFKHIANVAIINHSNMTGLKHTYPNSAPEWKPTRKYESSDPDSDEEVRRCRRGMSLGRALLRWGTCERVGRGARSNLNELLSVFMDRVLLCFVRVDILRKDEQRTQRWSILAFIVAETSFHTRNGNFSLLTKDAMITDSMALIIVRLTTVISPWRQVELVGTLKQSPDETNSTLFDCTALMRMLS